MTHPRSFSRAFARRALALFAGTAALALAATPAWSQAARPRDEAACQDTLKDAKAKEQDGALQAAKTLLRMCAQTPCSTFVRQQCANKYNRLDLDTPTVVLVVTDAGGGARGDVQVRVDGEPFATKIDGSALAIDPGMHDFSFIVDGHVFATQKIMIVQGQRNRFITALLRTGGKSKRSMVADAPVEKAGKKVAKADDEDSDAATPAKSSKTVAAAGSDKSGDQEETETKTEEVAPKKSGSVLPYLFTGLGIASLGAGAALTYWGIKDNQKMVSECSPNCLPATVTHVKQLYLASDVALGVGVASLAVAYWTHIMSRHAEEKATEEALRVDVVPTTSGGFAAVSGTF